MTFQIITSGVGRQSLLAQLGGEMRATRPSVVGVASAYLSAFGVMELKRLVSIAGSRECHMLAGIDGEITHPNSLKMALDIGWTVRIGEGGGGIFHPKLMIGGRQFDPDGLVTEPSCLYLGSGNITRGGLVTNVECGVISRNRSGLAEHARAFREMWSTGRDLTQALLRDYATRFATRNRQRTAHDLAFLGVADDPGVLRTPPTELRGQAAPNSSQRAIETEYAAVAWAGLQSFTGEYQFQIEFPRAAGEVVQRLVGSLGPGQRVEVACEDGMVRTMNFHFYNDNSMFRLNVPFDVPGVDWARANRDGIAVVSRGRRGGPQIRLQIIKPGRQMDDIVAKAVALGTWGKTPTRLYGWM